MDTAERVQILDAFDCILQSTNTIKKSINRLILSPSMGIYLLLILWFGCVFCRIQTLVSYNPVYIYIYIYIYKCIHKASVANTSYDNGNLTFEQ